MKPPTWFTNRLTAYDPALRCRWGHRTKAWIIERRLPERHKQLLAERPNPWKGHKGWDLYDGWREGYVHVLSVHPSLLNDQVFDHLAESDAWRVGGFEGINKKLDALEEQWDQETDKVRTDWCEDAGKEAADRMMWLGGHRIATPFGAPPEPEWDIEQRDGYIVRTKRGAQENAV